MRECGSVYILCVWVAVAVGDVAGWSQVGGCGAVGWVRMNSSAVDQSAVSPEQVCTLTTSASTQAFIWGGPTEAPVAPTVAVST